MFNFSDAESQKNKKNNNADAIMVDKGQNQNNITSDCINAKKKNE